MHELTTSDGATVRGVLATVPGARTVVALMHPRQDVTHHALVPILLSGRGSSVDQAHTWSVNNDLTLVHEQALLDVAVGLVFLRDRFGSVVTLGHSGGGPLYAFYLEQAGPSRGRRASRPRRGADPQGLADAELPLPDGARVPGPARRAGPAAAGVHRPVSRRRGRPAVRPSELDPFDPANGFAEPPASSTYAAEFLDRYRAAQRARVARIDADARATWPRRGGGSGVGRRVAAPTTDDGRSTR